MRHDRMMHESRGKDRTKTTITILSVIVGILVLVILFFFVVKPMLNKSALNNQIHGANLVYQDILSKVQQNGYYSIPVGNQTLVLVPYNPSQQQAGTGTTSGTTQTVPGTTGGATQ
jgi:predicted PurR-regulated permease PerM